MSNILFNVINRPKIAEDKDTKEKVKQRHRTEERNIKIRNTFSLLQEDDQEPILEEQQLHSVTKIDKEKKKEIKEGGRGKLGKCQNEKRESEMVPKRGLPKKRTNKGM